MSDQCFFKKDGVVCEEGIILDTSMVATFFRALKLLQTKTLEKSWENLGSECKPMSHR